MILRAVDSMIADVEQHDDSPDRDERLALLHRLRESLLDEDPIAD